MDNTRKNADDLKEQLSYITVHDGFKNASNNKKCEHELSVLLGYRNDNSVIYKCLFCGAEKDSIDQLIDSIIINASNYCKDNYDMDKIDDVESKFNIIRGIIFNSALENSQMTNSELQTMFNQNFNGRSYIKEK